MNEVKELIEELRNKKSRDNRELLDRSADMIEKLAKELCEKSGCHHKCHDTKDCVVEDEAKEVIANSATTTEKQIEEMAEHLIDIQSNFNEYCAKPCRECELDGIVNCENHYKAKALYNAGYRKQSEWISVEDRLPEKDGEVLVYNGKEIYTKMFMYPNEFTTFKKEPNFCYCDKSGDVWWIKSTDKITHWMPLPEAPKMKGGERYGRQTENYHAYNIYIRNI